MSAYPRVGPLAHPATEISAPDFDVAALLTNPTTQIIVCCGSGGVGKTTTSAALALQAAEAGRKVVVLTIDPAKRLAQSLGIEALDNTPRRVIDTDAGGSLDAMMLDMKRTFDEVVLAQASAAKAEAILANPFYVALSSSFAGTQEYMAMEKLGQLHREGKWDLIVVDTPPSRSALDFLDAPERLSSFLDGKLIKLLSGTARGPARLMSAGFSVISGALSKVLGGQLLSDVQAFVAAMDTVFGGFRQRAQQTYALLQANGTAFVVVAAPEPDALREAAYFVERLNGDAMPLAGLVINRATIQPLVTNLSSAAALTAAEALDRGVGMKGEQMTAADGPPGAAATTAGLLRLYADRATRITHETQLVHRFALAHPRVAIRAVPALPTDVHDLAGLRRVGLLLR